MYFGVDYHPEHWVYPYAGTPENPEGRWERDVQLMVEAGVNVVRMGEFAWVSTSRRRASMTLAGCAARWT